VSNSALEEMINIALSVKPNSIIILSFGLNSVIYPALWKPGLILS